MHAEDAWDSLNFDTCDDDALVHAFDDDADLGQGEPPPASTNETAAEVLGLYRRLGVPTRGFVALTVGPSRRGVQAEVGRPDARGVRRPGSLPDVSILLERPRAPERVNIEFDPQRQIDTHFRDHLRAMAQAYAARGKRGLPTDPLGTTRSVFAGTSRDGRIREIRHAHYEAQGGRVRQVWDGRVVLPRPLTPAQAVRAHVFETLAAAQAVLRRQQASLRRGALRGRRGARFDAFDAFDGEAAMGF